VSEETPVGNPSDIWVVLCVLFAINEAISVNKTILACLICVFSSPLDLKAETLPDSSQAGANVKLDSLLKIQNETAKQITEIQNTTRDIYREQKNDPLRGKRFGIELNPLWLLYMNEGFQLTGGFSLFNIDRGAEIAFPVVYRTLESSDASAFYLGAHYRYFLGNTQNGFYLSALGEYNHSKYQSVDWDTEANRETHTISRLGIGFGIGTRIFSYRGLYWGSSLSVGRYLWKSKEYEDFSPDGIMSAMTNDLLFDIEFFKFGWAF
jgi:hypothetical protein